MIEPEPCTRRNLLQHGAVGFGWLASSAMASESSGVQAFDERTMQPIDYGRSFSLATGPGNQPRFYVESRTRLIDEKTGKVVDFIQTAQCRGERTFGAADRSLFLDNAQHGSRIFGPDRVVWYRIRKQVIPKDRWDGKTFYGPEPWGGPVRHHLVEVESRELTTDEAIVQATHAFVPLVGQTEIWNEKRKLRAIIEFPIKTMNTILPRDMKAFERDYIGKGSFKAMDTKGRTCVYQVDTGPVAFPDLGLDHDDHAERISLAYVAFNRPDIVDFVAVQPTPIEKDGRELCRVHFFSNFVHLPSRNRIFAVK